MRELLYPLSGLYSGVAAVRNWLYDRRWLRIASVPPPVIAIGNLTMGGTGKTPVAMALMVEMIRRGFSVGLVSRGYRRETSGVFPVDTGASAAAQFGDEPTLIKSKFPNSPVYVGENRSAAARQLVEENKVDLIFCDDAFQHRSFHRDLDLLLIDCTEDPNNYRVFPVGRGRESSSKGLARADYILLTRANLVSKEKLQELKQWTEGKSKKGVVVAEFKLSGLVSQRGVRATGLDEAVYLVSGVGKPDTVEQLAREKIQVVRHKKFMDHHRYTNLEVEAMLDEASQLNARWIVTTAKDATKLAPFPQLKERLWVMELGVEFSSEGNSIFSDIEQLVQAAQKG